MKLPFSIQSFFAHVGNVLARAWTAVRDDRLGFWSWLIVFVPVAYAHESIVNYVHLETLDTSAPDVKFFLFMMLVLFVLAVFAVITMIGKMKHLQHKLIPLIFVILALLYAAYLLKSVAGAALLILYPTTRFAYSAQPTGLGPRTIVCADVYSRDWRSFRNDTHAEKKFKIFCSYALSFREYVFPCVNAYDAEHPGIVTSEKERKDRHVKIFECVMRSNPEFAQ